MGQKSPWKQATLVSRRKDTLVQPKMLAAALFALGERHYSVTIITGQVSVLRITQPLESEKLTYG